MSTSAFLAFFHSGLSIRVARERERDLHETLRIVGNFRLALYWVGYIRTGIYSVAATRGLLFSTASFLTRSFMGKLCVRVCTDATTMCEVW